MWKWHSQFRMFYFVLKYNLYQIHMLKNSQSFKVFQLSCFFPVVCSKNNKWNHERNRKTKRETFHSHCLNTIRIHEVGDRLNVFVHFIFHLIYYLVCNWLSIYFVLVICSCSSFVFFLVFVCVFSVKLTCFVTTARRPGHQYFLSLFFVCVSIHVIVWDFSNNSCTIYYHYNNTHVAWLQWKDNGQLETSITIEINAIHFDHIHRCFARNYSFNPLFYEVYKNIQFSRLSML